ncbi:MAG: hypothetical protein KAT05_02350 [Spirochaetes bacterium]|nr:hypothetical protein [Spirochaetota bacterium]
MIYIRKSIFLFLLIFIAVFLNSSSEILQDNEFYKKAVELLNLANQEYDRGDYDKGYEYSEEAKGYLKKANEFNMIQILIIRINTQKELAVKKIEKAKSMGADKNKDTLKLYETATRLFAEGENYYKTGDTQTEYKEQSNSYQKAIDYFASSAEKAKEAMNILAPDMDKDDAEYLLKQAYDKREQSIKHKVIQHDDEDDKTIINILKEAERTFNNKNYTKSKKNSQNAIAIMDSIAKRKQANKMLNMAKNALNNAKTKGLEKEYPDKIKDADNILDKAITFFEKENYNESIKNSKYVIDLINELGYSLVFPKYYKIRLITSKRDCLWRIAKYDFIYNDGFKWQTLYNANKDKLQRPKNPDLIHPWRILVIPSINGEIREGTYDPKKEYPKFDPKMDYGK